MSEVSCGGSGISILWHCNNHCNEGYVNDRMMWQLILMHHINEFLIIINSDACIDDHCFAERCSCMMMMMMNKGCSHVD